MGKPFNHYFFNWSIDGLRLCMSHNDMSSKILYGDKNCAIVHVKCYEDSVLLGDISDWCISQHESSWEQYVIKPNGAQIFFYDFTKSPTKDDDSLIGATYVLKDGHTSLMCCFVRPNYPIQELHNDCETDETAMNIYMFEGVFNGTKLDLYDYIERALRKDEHIKRELKKKEMPELIPEVFSIPFPFFAARTANRYDDSDAHYYRTWTSNKCY